MILLLDDLAESRNSVETTTSFGNAPHRELYRNYAGLTDTPHSACPIMFSWVCSIIGNCGSYYRGYLEHCLGIPDCLGVFCRKENEKAISSAT